MNIGILAEEAHKELQRRARKGTRTPFSHQIAKTALRGKNTKTPRPNTYYWTKNEDNALINFLKRPNIFTETGRIRWHRVPANSILRKRLAGDPQGKQLRKRWEKLMILYPNRVPIRVPIR